MQTLNAPKPQIRPERDYRRALIKWQNALIRAFEIGDDAAAEAATRVAIDQTRPIGSSVVAGVTRQVVSSLRTFFGRKGAEQRVGRVLQQSTDNTLESFVRTNTQLIRTLSTEIKEAITVEVLKDPTDLAALATRVQEASGFARARAELIATDQVGKLQSKISDDKHVAAGLSKYRWRTSKDERVRKLHDDLDGKVYAYGQPTDAEGGLSPGQPVRCRCVAEPIFEELE